MTQVSCFNKKQSWCLLESLMDPQQRMDDEIRCGALTLDQNASI